MTQSSGIDPIVSFNRFTSDSSFIDRLRVWDSSSSCTQATVIAAFFTLHLRRQRLHDNDATQCETPSERQHQYCEQVSNVSHLESLGLIPSSSSNCFAYVLSYVRGRLRKTPIFPPNAVP